MKKLKKDLLNCLKREKLLIDIILFGSALKSKNAPNDIDLALLFREKQYEQIEEITYAIKKIGDANNTELDIEPIVIDDFYKKPICFILLHEGFSIKNNAFISEMIKMKPGILISYSLQNKNKSDKVRFSYALYGRKKGEGFLRAINGKEAGKGSIIIPTEKEEAAKSFFKQWETNINEQRIFLKE